MECVAILHTVQNLGDHGRETKIALDVTLETTIGDLLHHLRKMGGLQNDYLEIRATNTLEK